MSKVEAGGVGGGKARAGDEQNEPHEGLQMLARKNNENRETRIGTLACLYTNRLLDVPYRMQVNQCSAFL